MDNQKFPPDISTLVEPTPQYPRPDDTTMAREEFNDKTFTKQTSYDPERFHETYGTLMQYVTGTPIRVTYYHQILPDDGERTAFGDTDFIEDDSHVDLEQIINFEFRTESQFNFNWDSERGESTFSGEGITYPGFEPIVGDMFAYKIHDSVGLFTITHIEPLSLRQGAYHKIAFTLRSRLGEKERNVLMTRSRSTSVFDIQKCLGESITLLKSESYLILEKLRETRKSLVPYYHNKFYDPLIESYMRPDGLYDPYLVTYMLKKISSTEVRRRPMNLVMVNDYENTIWSLFTYQRHESLDLVNPSFEVITKQDGIFGTQINGLINKPFLRITNANINYTSGRLSAGSIVSTGNMNDAFTPAKEKQIASTNKNNTQSNQIQNNQTTQSVKREIHLDDLAPAEDTKKIYKLLNSMPDDHQINDDTKLPSNVLTQEQLEEKNSSSTTIVDNKNGSTTIIERIDPIHHHDPHGHGPLETVTIKETSADGNTYEVKQNYYYYKPNIHHWHNHTFFKEPHCFHLRPPCKKHISFENDDDLTTSLDLNGKIVTPYVFSWAFYYQFSNRMNEIERLVYDWITTGTVNPKQVSDLTATFRKLAPEQLFYFGPIYLHLIDVAIRSIT